MKVQTIPTSLGLLVVWFLLVLRGVIIVVFVLGVPFLLPKIRGYQRTFTSLLILAFVSAFIPVDFTFTNQPGAPRFVGICDHRVEGGREQVFKNVFEGKCRVPSDLGPAMGVPIKWYLVR